LASHAQLAVIDELFGNDADAPHPSTFVLVAQNEPVHVEEQVKPAPQEEGDKFDVKPGGNVAPTQGAVVIGTQEQLSLQLHTPSRHWQVATQPPAACSFLKYWQVRSK